jgi:predicted porin
MKRFAAISFVSAVTFAGSWCSSALGQSVSLYGIVDTGVEYLHNANAAGNSLVRMPGNTGEVPSRWGLTGSEPLGNGYRAVFTLESGFTPGTGTLGQGGRLFGRQAFVGLDGPLGALTFGRQYSMMFWSVQSADFIGPDIYGFSSLDPWMANARIDNTVAYRKSFNGLNVGASYSFGRDASPAGGSNSPGQGTCAGEIAGNAEACAEWSVMLQYDARIWGVAAAYDRENGGPGAAANLFNGITPLGLTDSGNRDSRLALSAFAKLDKFVLGAVWLNRRVDSASTSTPDVTSNQFALEAQYKFSPALFFDAMVQRVDNRQQDTRATMEMLRATYLLTVRTAVYAQVAALQNSAHAAYSVSSGGASTPGKGMSQIGTMVGIRHSF